MLAGVLSNVSWHVIKCYQMLSNVSGCAWLLGGRACACWLTRFTWNGTRKSRHSRYHVFGNFAEPQQCLHTKCILHCVGDRCPNKQHSAHVLNRCMLRRPRCTEPVFCGDRDAQTACWWATLPATIFRTGAICG